MRRFFGLFVMVTVLAWPCLVLGDEYSFGGSGVSSGSSGKSGLYLAPRFLNSITNTGEINGSGGLASRTRYTLGGAIAGGFDFSHFDPRIPLRAEIEYAARSNVRSTWGSAPNGGKFKALFNVQTLQANAYWDIETGMAFKPFVSCGLGASFIYADYKPSNGRNYSDSTTGLAWNVGAGVGYDLNESVTVDLSYRFAGFGYAEAKRSESSTTRNYMTANEILLGLRLKF